MCGEQPGGHCGWGSLSNGEQQAEGSEGSVGGGWGALGTSAFALNATGVGTYKVLNKWKAWLDLSAGKELARIEITFI